LCHQIINNNLKRRKMRTTKKIKDLIGREHVVDFIFTVRTFGYKCWKVSAELTCKGEKASFSYQSNNIEDYIDAPDKAGNLFQNIPPEINIEIQDWLSDVFPRYKIVDANTGEMLTEERTKNDAHDTQSSYYFVETLIIDTWNVKR
jgi:hypothetical protein